MFAVCYIGNVALNLYIMKNSVKKTEKVNVIETVNVVETVQNSDLNAYLEEENKKALIRYKAKLIRDKEREAKKGLPKVETAKKLSNKVLEKLEKIKNFDSENAGSYERLGQVSRKVDIEYLNLNSALNKYIEVAKSEGFSAKQLSKLNKSNCKKIIAESVKYKDLALFTTDDIKKICQLVLVKFDVTTARAKKVALQGGTVGKKADKITANVK